MNEHKKVEWLKSSLAQGKTIEKMAQEAKTTPEAIKDAMKKNGISDNNMMPETDNDKTILKWCGENRKPIPPDVTNTTKPDNKAAVMVLGSTGFVGKNLISYLNDNTDYRIIALSRTECDLMQRQSFIDKLKQTSPDVVINLAAFVGGIGLNKDNPADMMYKNLIMSTNVVDACFTAGTRKLIFVGSVCSYGCTPPHIPFIEEDLWEGRPEPTNEPYGLAKKTIGLLLDAYKRQYNFSSVYLIPTNMYGPHDDFNINGSHVIPAMIRKFLDAKKTGKPVIQWGDGSASRDFLFVDDFCAAIDAAITTIDDPTPINIGSGVEHTMKDLSSAIAKMTGYVGQVIWDATKPNGQPRRCLDITKARRQLGITPRTDLETGLRATIEWYTSQE